MKTQEGIETKTQQEIDGNYHLIADRLLELLNEYTNHIEWEIVATEHLDWWYAVSVRAKIGDFFMKIVSVTFDLGEELRVSQEAKTIIDHVIGALRNSFYSQVYDDMLIEMYREKE